MCKKILLAAFILTFLLGNTVQAAWSISKKSDPMSDDVTVFSGVTSNDRKLRFYLYSEDNGDVTAGLRITKGFQQIHYNPKKVVLRVDKKDTHTIKYNSWEPKLIFFDIDKDIGLLEDLMDGKLLRMQYYSSSNTSSIAEFSLKGSTKAINAAVKGYVRKEVREARAAEERKEAAAKREEEYRRTQQERDEKISALKAQGKYVEPTSERERAELDCPNELAAIERAESETGRPQMFRGCSHWGVSGSTTLEVDPFDM